MYYSSMLKFGFALTSGSVTLAVFHKDIYECYTSYVSKFSVHAATIDSKKWDNNWDRRSHEQPSATRHIILIRHGQYNLSGLTDQEKYLTELGKQQAISTGKRLKSLGLDKKISSIMVSTMTRAFETNKLICNELGFKHDSEFVTSSDLLREGAPIEPDPPTKYWNPEPQTFFVDGSRIETAFRNFIHRADVSQKNDSVEIIVCHANVIRYFVCRALQLPPEAWLRISLRHASITQLVIRPNGKVSLKALGDTGHLPPEKLTFE